MKYKYATDNIEMLILDADENGDDIRLMKIISITVNVIAVTWYNEEMLLYQDTGMTDNVIMML